MNPNKTIKRIEKIEKKNLWCVLFGFNLWLQWLWVMFKIYEFNFWLIFKISGFGFWFGFMFKNSGFTIFF